MRLAILALGLLAVATLLYSARVVQREAPGPAQAPRALHAARRAAAPRGFLFSAAAADDERPLSVPTARGAGADAVLPPHRLLTPVWWHSPIWSGSGYATEGVNFILSLLRERALGPSDVWASAHGDEHRPAAVAAQAPADRAELERAQAQPALQRDARRPAIVVCHSLPTNWRFPEPSMWWSGEPCPPDQGEYAWAYTVGRTMFETDLLPQSFVPRLNALNEVWVPSEWARASFELSGVEPRKLVVVPEGVNTTQFDPARARPLDLHALGERVFGAAPAARAPAAGAGAGAGAATAARPRPFRFLSSFKWERRKGWDVLLEAYLGEFSAADDVELHVLTRPFMDSGGGFKAQMRAWAAERGLAGAGGAAGNDTGAGAAPARAPPALSVITRHIADADFPSFYRSGDAFVLPSRGEGWGRPHVEAMAMGLPLIATNWSGITAYLDGSVGYPIAIDGLVPVGDGGGDSAWWFAGLKWAQPSVAHLRQLMRRVYTHRAEAAARGAAARQRMVERYSPPVIAATLAAELRRIERALLDE